MKITYLGQAGLLFDFDGYLVVIDAYLSDNVVTVNPLNYRRKPVDERYLELVPDVTVCTHDHLDHYDVPTMERYLSHKEKQILFLGPRSAWDLARKNGNGHNYVEFDRGTVWTEHGIRFKAVRAVHSDPYAIGVIIEAEGKKYYITGDTLLNDEIFADLPDDLFAVFLPINGLGNNMNAVDAAEFAKRTGAAYAVPLHVGMFDEMTPDIFNAPNRVIPEIYKEIKF